jgi:hypothetical protein
MARIPFTTWMGDGLAPRDPLTGKMTGNPRGLVLHISDGLKTAGGEAIPDLGGLLATFNATNFPAHFGIDSAGRIAQYIDTAKQDRATERGDDWFSVECCCFRGRALTPSQVSSAGFLFALLHQWYLTFDLKPATSRSDTGLAYHSMFLTDAEKQDPHKHSGCPGTNVIAQRDDIVAAAHRIFG